MKKKHHEELWDGWSRRHIEMWTIMNLRYTAYERSCEMLNVHTGKLRLLDDWTKHGRIQIRIIRRFGKT